MCTFYKWLALSITGISVCLSAGTLVAPSLFQTFDFLIFTWISLSIIICVMGIIKSYDYIRYISLSLLNMYALIYGVLSLYMI